MFTSDAKVLRYGDILRKQDGTQWLVKRGPHTSRIDPHQVDVLLVAESDLTTNGGHGYGTVWMTERDCYQWKFVSDRDGHR